MDEKSTKASTSSPRSESRCSAPATLAPRSAAKWSGVASASGASSAWTAACMTARTGSPWSARPVTSASTASRSAMSQAATVTRAPSPVSSRARSSAPGASPPRRLVRTRWGAPSRASHRATWAPRAPSPPVMSTVPSGRQRRAGAVRPREARTMRRATTPPARTASWSSPAGSARMPQSLRSARSSGVSGRSTSPPQTPDCSRAATRPTPHTCACTALVSVSEGAVATAPRVRHQSGAVASRSRSACTRETVPARPAETSGWVSVGFSSNAHSDSTPRRS
ncbi:hypothetical protein Sgri01_07200 [Streptomyces griseus]